MSAFTPQEISYLEGQTLGRLATVGPDGRPHLLPLTYVFNRDEDTIDLGGIDFANGKKWRDAQANPKVTFLVDDADQTGARAIEIRGDAELHENGGSAINPRFPNFVEPFLRLRPRRIVSWGLSGASVTKAADIEISSRAVP